MMKSPPALLALVLAALSPSAALLTPFNQRSARHSSTLSYSIGGGDDDPPFSPQPRPRSLRLRIGSDFQQWQHRVAQPTTEKSFKTMIRPSQRVPRRAMPHVRNVTHAEAATRAGYIIRQGDATWAKAVANEPAGSWKDLRQIGLTVRGARVRPLRYIRRIVHRGNGSQIDQQGQIIIEAPLNKNSVDVHIRSRPSNKFSRLSLSNRSQIDELLTTEQMLPDKDERKGARRVTFKATRETSKVLISKPMATLTEYMTQPVSQYSLLSFHDAEGSRGSENPKQPLSRRWHVRRLSKEEAKNYIISASSSEDAEVMDESNLFRLAVPLLPLIGWDLTPVIDLEVVPPKNYISGGAKVKDGSSIHDHMNEKTEETYVIYETLDETCHPESTSSSTWAPLRGIRKRMSQRGSETKSCVANSPTSPPVVKIRSLRVSLLSTQKEVNEVMSSKNKNSKINQSRGSMQREAIEMVGKVEEWLRPHITFEAELSWNDGVSNFEGVHHDSPSTVTVKSTAITSLTIPMIQSDIIRKSVPSAFLVKRLGATLTSRALAVCLPRFLNQLEKDYNRWSGLGLSGGKADETSK
ncbi:hypothetical protein ACHAW5_009210 [Stephanodiscus triporus]|uniref:Uncharacterized protein n=1 Tax=Stephanodiscus triporus TaxID=2934178 RepID=A0ABD3PM62_9STRA